MYHGGWSFWDSTNVFSPRLLLARAFSARSATTRLEYIGPRPKRPTLPPRYTIYYYANLFSVPKELFEELNKVLLHTNGAKVQQYHILVLLLRLRQICDHPALIRQMIDKEEFENQGGVDQDESNTRENIFQKVLLPVKKTTNGITSYGISHNNPMRSDNPVFKESYESSKVVN